MEKTEFTDKIAILPRSEHSLICALLETLRHQREAQKHFDGEYVIFRITETETDLLESILVERLMRIEDCLELKRESKDS